MDTSKTEGDPFDGNDDSSQNDVEMLRHQSIPNFELSEEVEQRYSRHGSGEGSNCSSTLPLPSRNNSGVRDNSESFSASEEDVRTQEDEDEVFVDAVTELDYSPFNTHDTSGRTFEFGVASAGEATTSINSPSSPIHRENNGFGLLERCGRWLMSIPRDDVVALQNTTEYMNFLDAFDRLGEAHRRTVMLERRHLLETEDATLLASSDTVSDGRDQDQSSDISHAHASLTVHPFTRYQQYPWTLGESRRRHFSFLQHLAVDDILLRTFEYIDCSSLVKTGATCHRFHELTNQSAEQRVASLADGRLLRSAMKMLRAQEQIEGVGVFERTGQYVPIPMLGLRRRIKVTGAGDPEFNGIYFCTGCNGNGFLFTKPRVPEQRVLGGPRNFGQPVVGQAPLGRAQLQHIDVEGLENPIRDPVGVANAAMEDDDNEDDNDQRDGGVDVLFGDEPNRSRLLRCVISKRFSNEVRTMTLM
jgi:hypothetical protein